MIILFFRLSTDLMFWEFNVGADKRLPQNMPFIICFITNRRSRRKKKKKKKLNERPSFSDKNNIRSLYVCLSVCLTPSVCLSIYLSTSLSPFLWITVSLDISPFLSTSLSVTLSFSLSLSLLNTESCTCKER